MQRRSVISSVAAGLFVFTGCSSTSPDMTQADVPSPLPELRTLAAQAAGRHGQDLLLTVSGADAESDVTELRVRFETADQSPVLLFDTNLDGTLDSNEGPVRPDASVSGQAEFTATATLAALFVSSPEVGVVEVALADAAGNTSTWATAVIAAQPVRQAGLACDPQYIADRCDVGLGCHGTPPTCGLGDPPQISELAYLRAPPGGPRLLFEGTVPDDNLETIAIEFLDSADNPVAVDLDSDGTPESTSFDINAQDASRNGAFFVALLAADGFDALVSKIAATPIDEIGRTGVRKTTALANPPSRSMGQGCDPRGFDHCVSPGVCAPGIVGETNTCKNAATLRASECAAATVLDPGQGPVSATGRAVGASLWDAPAGCAHADPIGKPEGVVRLHLAAPAAQLTLTTDRPGTSFDTVMYLLPGCPANSEAALSCGDDDATSAFTTLVVANVPAGDYLVVVDSFDDVGGSFELAVSVP